MITSRKKNPGNQKQVPKLQPIQADSYKDLRRQLKQIDDSVPYRGKGRKTEHVEIWSIYRFLSTFGDTSLISYPLQIKHADRPDLRLIMPTDAVGIEITEAVDRQRAHHDAIANQHECIGLQDASLFRYGHPEYSNEEIHRMAVNPVTKLEGPGWAGNEAEQGWAASISERIGRKARSFEDAGFDRNWLVVYDNTNEQLLVDVGEAIPLLLKNLHAIRGNDSHLPFDMIFIEHGSYYIKIEDARAEKIALMDLRSKKLCINFWRKLFHH